MIAVEPLQTEPDAQYDLQREQQFKQDQSALSQRFKAKQARESEKKSIQLSASRFADHTSIAQSVTAQSVTAQSSTNQSSTAQLFASTPPLNIEKLSSAAAIQLATVRSQIKKLEKQLAVMPSDAKRQTDLEALKTLLAQLNAGETT
jgi:Na+-translocating ferredoxin:NAD+ oxidoreductase subunit B